MANEAVTYIDKLDLGGTEYSLYGQGISDGEGNTVEYSDVAKSTTTPIEIPVNSWTQPQGSTMYTQTIAVEGITVDSELSGFFYTAPSTTSTERAKQKRAYDIFAYSGEITTSNGSITLSSPNSIPYTFYIVIMGV